MAQNTKIEWASATWNPVLGCSKKSAGCRKCYAIRQVHRLAGNPNASVQSANQGLTVIRNGEIQWTGKVRLIDKRLEIPQRRRKPTTYFVNSLSDLFHPSLPEWAIQQVFWVMYDCPQHIFQVLTKHGETKGRLPDVMGRIVEMFGPLPANIWMGVSVEDKAHLHRIDLLRQVPAAVRFLSLEPLLEDLGQLNLTGIDWVIVGGESGKEARPFWTKWAYDIIEQSRVAGVPCFVKQLGKRPICFTYDDWPDGTKYDGKDLGRAGIGVGDKPWGMRAVLKDRKGGEPSEWPEDLRIRQVPYTQSPEEVKR